MAELIRTVLRDSPRQREIVDALRARIVAGELAPGDRIPSVTELAAAHEASTRTVQSALTHMQENGFISSKPGAGSFVAEAPPHLTNFGVVFVVAPQPDGWWSQFYVAWKCEVEKYMAPGGEGGKEGLRATFYYLDERTQNSVTEDELYAAVEADLLAGLIFPVYPNFFRNMRIADNIRMPKVACSSIQEEGFTILELAPDGQRKALNYLASRGRRKVAFLTGSMHHREEEPTERLIRLAAECGLESRRCWVQGIDIDSPVWASNWAELLCKSGTDRPGALYIMDDNLVPDATRGLVNAGVRVPEDIEVVVHCNFPYPTSSAVPAKRIGYDVRQLLKTSIDTIRNLRAAKPVPDIITIDSISDDQMPQVAAEE